jgi:hypothetical protein
MKIESAIQYFQEKSSAAKGFIRRIGNIECLYANDFFRLLWSEGL